MRGHKKADTQCHKRHNAEHNFHPFNAPEGKQAVATAGAATTEDEKEE